MTPHERLRAKIADALGIYPAEQDVDAILRACWEEMPDVEALYHLASAVAWDVYYEKRGDPQYAGCIMDEVTRQVLIVVVNHLRALLTGGAAREGK